MLGLISQTRARLRGEKTVYLIRAEKKQSSENLPIPERVFFQSIRERLATAGSR